MPIIGGRKLELPIIQGGMGVGVSLGRLAGSVAACGAMGVISSANTGFAEPDFWHDSLAANIRALKAEIAKAKRIAGGRGMVGVNVMVATSQYHEAVRAAAEAGADAVICGAGLPLDLPAAAGDGDTLLAPIVSSGKAAHAICRMWDRRFGRVPDFVVIEGAEAGGHLGFKLPELISGKASPLLHILAEVKAILKPFEEKYCRKIPIFTAGGVFSGDDVAACIEAGAAGAQIATRFIATPECDADERYKEIMLAAKPEDVQIVQSPVGMPGRALNSPLFARIKELGRIKPEHCIHCITTCNPAETPYCITRALIEAVKGNWEQGLFFCGSNVGRVKKMLHVDELLHELCGKLR